jgi:hypothetical protein
LVETEYWSRWIIQLAYRPIFLIFFY